MNKPPPLLPDRAAAPYHVNLTSAVVKPPKVYALKEVARGLGGRWRGGLVINSGGAIKPPAPGRRFAVMPVWKWLLAN